MNFRMKLLLLTLLPVLVLSTAALLLISYQSNQLAQLQGTEVENYIRQSKKTELRNYIKLARTAVEPFYQWDNVSRSLAQQYVSDVFNQMTFGEDGYFFVYKGDGTNVVHPRLPHMVGKNWIDLEDSDGRRVISDLIELGRNGGEFYRYMWNKPSTGANAEKLGFSFYLEKWDWMIGSGLYMDDIAEQIASIRQQLERNVQQTQWVLIGLAIGTVGLTGLLFAGLHHSEQRLANTRLKQLAARIVDTQEEERKRVSRELHDGISQLLVSARYGLENALNSSSRSKDIAEPIEKSMIALNDAIAEVRRISMALRPSILDDMGLAAALKSLGAEFSKQTGISVDIDAEPLNDLLSDEAKTALYRVTQEALTNVARHSGGNHVKISLCRRGAKAVMELEDNGNGMPGNARLKDSANGLGIRNMQERIDTFDGTIRFTRSRRGGLAIKVTLPVVKRKK